MAEEPTEKSALVRSFPDPKAPIFHHLLPCGASVSVGFSSTNGTLIGIAYDSLTDECWVSRPIVTEDWRSFGFQELSKLKQKHKEILFQRILHGLDIVDGELRLTWVWVVEARAKKEARDLLELTSSMKIQCSFRQHQARQKTGNIRRRNAALVLLQSNFRRCYHMRIFAVLKRNHKAATRIQMCFRVNQAMTEVFNRRERSHAAIIVQAAFRKVAALRKFSDFKRVTKAARKLQSVVRMRAASNVVETLRYARNLELRALREEKERARERAKMVAEQYKREKLELERQDKILAHKRWLADKDAKIKKKLEEERREEARKKAQEKAIRKDRQANIEMYRKRLAKRDRERKRKLKKMQRALSEAGATDPAADGLLPRLALAIGKPLSNAFGEAALFRKSIKRGKKGGGKELSQYKQKMKPEHYIPDYKESRKQADVGKKALLKSMKIEVAKKSPKREKQDKDNASKGVLPTVHPGSGKLSRKPNPHDSNMLFLTKKEKIHFNAIDNSPIRPTKLILGEQRIHDWAVR